MKSGLLRLLILIQLYVLALHRVGEKIILRKELSL